MSEKRPFPLHAGVAEVTATEQITPAMRRITFAHPDFGPNFGLEYPGEIISFIWADEDTELKLPPRGWRVYTWFLQTRRTHHGRNFTVRAHRPEDAEVDVDFFLHGDVGRASRWAAAAAPGDRLGFGGPRWDWRPADGSGWALLVADETALPALLTILDALPAGHRAIAVAEVADASEEQQPTVAADVDWRWLHRGRQPPGSTSLLEDTVAELTLPDGPGQAWGGGEARVMKAIRRDLKQRGVEELRLTGYWKDKGDGR